ncbi:hypothetical protein CALVIDRAFT_602794 [Calocera viscosa TUFC12733]|uniref:HMG box domain-containing protein n=1 Tax=Calocera viscosa (strain TUFC12733) TaxID=1330018 RepID=A0A167GJQ7_CALVF|nr:hypothetical protein CALVIDRAFT_602794 [Calocera viscosa TUFC12733]
MFAALVPRVFATARVAITPRAFVVSSRVLPLASRQFLFSSRSFAAAATATKRTSAPAKSSTTRTSTKPKAASTKRKKAAPKKKKKAAVKKPGRGSLGRPRKAKKTVKPKAKVDLPTPPKKTASPYALWVKDYFAGRGKTSLTQAEFRALGAQLGAEWKALPEADKQKYSEAAAQSRKDYHAAFAEWSQNITYPVLRQINKQRRLRKKTNIHIPGHSELIKPTNSYIIYVSDQRALPEAWEGAPEGNQARMIWFARRSAERWGTFSEAQKDVYRERAKKHNVAYKAQLAA